MSSATQIPELPDDEVALIFKINDLTFNRCVLLGMMHGEQTLLRVHPSPIKHAIGIYTCIFLQTVWIVCG